jgi:hypothetical protein
MKNKNFLKHLKKGLNYSVVGSIGLVVASTLSGCGDETPKETQVFSDVSKAQNTFFVIEEKPKGSFTVLEKHPTSGPTRAIVRDENGNERILNEDEIKKLAQAEAQKVENGTSNLMSENSGGGLSLGEAILAGAGGALLGSLVGNMIANKMMNNNNFQQAQRQANTQRSAITRSATNKPTTSKTTTSNPKSGFFGSKTTSTSKTSKNYSSSSYGG